MAVLFYLIYYLFFESPSARSGINVNKPEKSIAVLPFKNISDTLTSHYFIDGVMEEILTNLGRIHDLRVISRTSVEKYRNSGKSIPEIARLLQQYGSPEDSRQFQQIVRDVETKYQAEYERVRKWLEEQGML